MPESNEIIIRDVGLDPDGIYVFESTQMLTRKQEDYITEKFAAHGLKKVIVVCGGRFIGGRFFSKQEQKQ